MKRLAALTLCLSMVLSLAACGGSKPAPASSGSAAGSSSSTPSASTPSGSASSGPVDDTTGLKIPCDPIQLSMGCSGTVDGTVMGDAINKYLAELKDWTDGNFVINFYPSGQLGGDTDLIQGAQMGSVDIFNGAPTSQVGLIPQLAVLDIAGLYDNVDQCNQVLSGGFMTQIEPYYNNAGLHLLTAYTTNFRITSSNNPINSLADLQGLNLRVQENKYHIAFWKALGANPTPLAFGELYIALQQGMMDAQENPWTSYVGAKLCEVQKYMTLTNHIPFISTYVMNNAKYESLSDTQKQALNQFIYSVKKYIVEGTAADDARLQKLCEDQYGLTVSDVPADVKAKYPEATQAVIDLMKKDIDPAFVDNYVAAAKAATGK
ncbi:MAG: TRAP transporter substrate-binding protein [Lawsonibacter sp.]|nr:TRAP transporter substrate-binding protein [Lawsonibacter sp.]